MKKSLLLAVLVLLIALSGVSEARFTHSVNVVSNSILPFESATYDLSLTNKADVDDVVNIHLDANSWLVSPQTIVIPAGETVTERIHITPRIGVGLGNYQVPLTLQSTRTGQVELENVLLLMTVDLLSKGYPLNLDLNVESELEVDPRKPYQMRVVIKNNNLREIDNLLISVESDLFKEKVESPLQPLGVYRKTFSFNLDPMLNPSEHDLSVIVSVPEEEQVAAEDNLLFLIQGYSQVGQKIDVISKEFFKVKEKITISNKGNIENTRTISLPISWFTNLFITTSPKAKVITDELGQKKITWEVKLEPNETKEYIITTNKRPMVYFLLLLIILIVSYFLFRSPITIQKEVQIIRADEHGTNSMKVRLFIKNRSRKTINSLKVIDRVPRIAELIASAHLGTLQPTKVTKSEKRGTIIRWEIEGLEPFEERIISYNLKSKLKIVGNISLPSARVKFEAMGGKERVTSSGLSQVGK